MAFRIATVEVPARGSGGGSATGAVAGSAAGLAPGPVPGVVTGAGGDSGRVAGGGRLGIAPLPGRDGAPVADLAAAARWGAELVISATTQAEMAAAGVEDLGRMLADLGIPWRHFPIADFGIPEGTSGWPGLASCAHRVLDRGGGVLIHCRGGQGRSGMLALRLMVERGEGAEAALARLRAVRPGAVETDAQFAWAAAGRGGEGH